MRALGARIDDTTRYGNSPLLTAIRADSMLATAWLAERGARIVTENRSAYPLAAALDKIHSWNEAGPPGARATAEALLRAVQPAALRDSIRSVDVINDVLEQIPSLVSVLATLRARGWTPPLLPARMVASAIVIRDTVPEALERLRQQGVTLNPVMLGNRMMETSPLMMSMRVGAVDVAARLLMMGADPRIVDETQLSPYLMALSNVTRRAHVC